MSSYSGRSMYMPMSSHSRVSIRPNLSWSTIKEESATTESAMPVYDEMKERVERLKRLERLKERRYRDCKNLKRRGQTLEYTERFARDFEEFKNLRHTTVRPHFEKSLRDPSKSENRLVRSTSVSDLYSKSRFQSTSGLINKENNYSSIRLPSSKTIYSSMENILADINSRYSTSSHRGYRGDGHQGHSPTGSVSSIVTLDDDFMYGSSVNEDNWASWRPRSRASSFSTTMTSDFSQYGLPMHSHLNQDTLDDNIFDDTVSECNYGYGKQYLQRRAFSTCVTPRKYSTLMTPNADAAATVERMGQINERLKTLQAERKRMERRQSVDLSDITSKKMRSASSSMIDYAGTLNTSNFNHSTPIHGGYNHSMRRSSLSQVPDDQSTPFWSQRVNLLLSSRSHDDTPSTSSETEYGTTKYQGASGSAAANINLLNSSANLESAHCTTENVSDQESFHSFDPNDDAFYSNRSTPTPQSSDRHSKEAGAIQHETKSSKRIAAMSSTLETSKGREIHSYSKPYSPTTTITDQIISYDTRDCIDPESMSIDTNIDNTSHFQNNRSSYSGTVNNRIERNTQVQRPTALIQQTTHVQSFSGHGGSEKVSPTKAFNHRSHESHTGTHYGNVTDEMEFQTKYQERTSSTHNIDINNQKKKYENFTREQLMLEIAKLQKKNFDNNNKLDVSKSARPSSVENNNHDDILSSGDENIVMQECDSGVESASDIVKTPQTGRIDSFYHTSRVIGDSFYHTGRVMSPSKPSKSLDTETIQMIPHSVEDTVEKVKIPNVSSCEISPEIMQEVSESDAVFQSESLDSKELPDTFCTEMKEKYIEKKKLDEELMSPLSPPPRQTLDFEYLQNTEELKISKNSESDASEIFCEPIESDKYMVDKVQYVPYTKKEECEAENPIQVKAITINMSANFNLPESNSSEIALEIPKTQDLSKELKNVENKPTDGVQKQGNTTTLPAKQGNTASSTVKTVSPKTTTPKKKKRQHFSKLSPNLEITDKKKHEISEDCSLEANSQMSLDKSCNASLNSCLDSAKVSKEVKAKDTASVQITSGDDDVVNKNLISTSKNLTEIETNQTNKLKDVEVKFQKVSELQRENNSTDYIKMSIDKLTSKVHEQNYEVPEGSTALVKDPLVSSVNSETNKTTEFTVESVTQKSTGNGDSNGNVSKTYSPNKQDSVKYDSEEYEVEFPSISPSRKFFAPSQDELIGGKQSDLKSRVILEMDASSKVTILSAPVESYHATETATLNIPSEKNNFKTSTNLKEELNGKTSTISPKLRLDVEKKSTNKTLIEISKERYNVATDYTTSTNKIPKQDLKTVKEQISASISSEYSEAKTDSDIILSSATSSNQLQSFDSKYFVNQPSKETFKTQISDKVTSISDVIKDPVKYYLSSTVSESVEFKEYNVKDNQTKITDKNTDNFKISTQEAKHVTSIQKKPSQLMLVTPNVEIETANLEISWISTDIEKQGKKFQTVVSADNTSMDINKVKTDIKEKETSFVKTTSNQLQDVTELTQSLDDHKWTNIVKSTPFSVKKIKETLTFPEKLSISVAPPKSSTITTNLNEKNISIAQQTDNKKEAISSDFKEEKNDKSLINSNIDYTKNIFENEIVSSKHPFQLSTMDFPASIQSQNATVDSSITSNKTIQMKTTSLQFSNLETLEYSKVSQPDISIEQNGSFGTESKDSSTNLDKAVMEMSPKPFCYTLDSVATESAKNVTKSVSIASIQQTKDTSDISTELPKDSYKIIIKKDNTQSNQQNLIKQAKNKPSSDKSDIQFEQKGSFELKSADSSNASYKSLSDNSLKAPEHTSQFETLNSITHQIVSPTNVSVDLSATDCTDFFTSLSKMTSAEATMTGKDIPQSVTIESSGFTMDTQSNLSSDQSNIILLSSESSTPLFVLKNDSPTALNKSWSDTVKGSPGGKLADEISYLKVSAKEPSVSSQENLKTPPQPLDNNTNDRSTDLQQQVHSTFESTVDKESTLTKNLVNITPNVTFSKDIKSGEIKHPVPQKSKFKLRQLTGEELAISDSPTKKTEKPTLKLVAPDAGTLLKAKFETDRTVLPTTITVTKEMTNKTAESPSSIGLGLYSSLTTSSQYLSDSSSQVLPDPPPPPLVPRHKSRKLRLISVESTDSEATSPPPAIYNTKPELSTASPDILPELKYKQGCYSQSDRSSSESMSPDSFAPRKEFTIPENTDGSKIFSDSDLHTSDLDTPTFKQESSLMSQIDAEMSKHTDIMQDFMTEKIVSIQKSPHTSTASDSVDFDKYLSSHPQESKTKTQENAQEASLQLPESRLSVFDDSARNQPFNRSSSFKNRRKLHKQSHHDYEYDSDAVPMSPSSSIDDLPFQNTNKKSHKRWKSAELLEKGNKRKPDLPPKSSTISRVKSTSMKLLSRIQPKFKRSKSPEEDIDRDYNTKSTDLSRVEPALKRGKSELSVMTSEPLYQPDYRVTSPEQGAPRKIKTLPHTKKEISESTPVRHKSGKHGKKKPDQVVPATAAAEPSPKVLPNGDNDLLIKERLHLHPWDPSALLMDIYTIRLMPDDTEDISTKFIEMEGVMEKLPMNKKKSTLLKTWKRRYFRARNGWLIYYDNRNDEKPSDEILLMGGSISIMGNRIIGIDDGRGHYLMVRCPSSKEYEQWIAALQSQTVDNSEANYAHPTLSAPKHHQKNVLIIEMGSMSIRAGILKENSTLPQLFFPNVIAVNKDQTKHFVGFEAYKPDIRHSSIMHQTFGPSDKVDKFKIDMEVLPSLFTAIFQDLRVAPSEYQVMLVLPTNLGKPERKNLMDILIDQFHVGGVCMAPQAITALYSYNTRSGIMVDIGERMEILPIYEGFAINGGQSVASFGAGKIRQSLRSGLTSHNNPLYTPLEQIIVRHVMEQTCYISQKYGEDLEKFKAQPEKYSSSVYLTKYNLPEGTYGTISHDVSCFSSPEGLFNTDLWGMDYPPVQSLVMKAIDACPMDNRRHMCRAIYLSGGITMIPGFAARLEAELQKLVNPSLVLQVHSSPQRYHAAYIGACLLSAMPEFDDSCISKDEWKRDGAKAFQKWKMLS